MKELKFWPATKKLMLIESTSDKVSFSSDGKDSDGNYYSAVGKDFAATVSVMLSGLQRLNSAYQESASQIEHLMNYLRLQVELIAQQNAASQPADTISLQE